MSKFLDLTKYGNDEKIILFKKSSVDGVVANEYSDHVSVAIYVSGGYYGFCFDKPEEADEFCKHVMKEIENE